MAKNPFNASSFVPTTNVWDVSRLAEIDVTSPEFKELLVRLYQNVNNIALLLNIKDTGVYNLFEIINGQTYFPDPTLNSSTTATPINRQVYRTTINFGALPNAGTKSVPHNITITPKTSFTRIYATASDPVNKAYVPIPYAAVVLADAIEMSVDATNVNITTAINLTNYTVCYAVLEYLQN